MMNFYKQYLWFDIKHLEFNIQHLYMFMSQNCPAGLELQSSVWEGGLKDTFTNIKKNLHYVIKM